MLDESRACERDANVRVSFADENFRGRSLRRGPAAFPRRGGALCERNSGIKSARIFSRAASERAAREKVSEDKGTKIPLFSVHSQPGNKRGNLKKKTVISYSARHSVRDPIFHNIAGRFRSIKYAFNKFPFPVSRARRRKKNRDNWLF